MGFTTCKNAEDCLLFRTGMPQRMARDVHQVIVSPVREHSRKPDEAFTRIERFCPGPRVALFAREEREGWDTWGDQVGMFNEPILTGAGDVLVRPTGPTGGTWCPLQPTGANLGLPPFEVPVGMARQELHSSSTLQVERADHYSRGTMRWVRWAFLNRPRK